MLSQEGLSKEERPALLHLGVLRLLLQKAQIKHTQYRKLKLMVLRR